MLLWFVKLEISLRASAHGFESHPLRQEIKLAQRAGFIFRCNRDSNWSGCKRTVRRIVFPRGRPVPQHRSNPILSAKKAESFRKRALSAFHIPAGSRIVCLPYVPRQNRAHFAQHVLPAQALRNRTDRFCSCRSVRPSRPAPRPAAAPSCEAWQRRRGSAHAGRRAPFV